MTTDGDARLRVIIERNFGISGQDADALLDEIETVTVTGGEWLMRQGDPADALYFLVRGRLQVWMLPDNDQQDLEPTLLGEITPGESVGEIGLLTGSPRTASVRAIRDSLLMQLDRDAFGAFAESHPTLVLRLAGSIAKRLTERTSLAPPASRHLVTIALVPLADRSWVDTFTNSVQSALQKVGTVLCLTAANLGQSGAPVDRLDPNAPIPDALRHWLDDAENRYRFVIYRGDREATSWSRLAVRQADIVLVLADADDAPAPGAAERALFDGDAGGVARRGLVLHHARSDVPISGTGAWLDRRVLDFWLHVRNGNDADVSRVARVLSGDAVGLVLGGGAARGFAEIGVYRAMTEAGIAPDWVGGTSIGGIIGAAIAFDRGPDDVHASAKDAFVNGKPFGDFTLPMISVLRGKRMERLTRLHLDGNIEDLPVPYFCVSSMLDRGTIHVHDRGQIWSAVRATAALPGMLPPAVVESRLAVDGGVLNNLPVDIMRQKPIGRVIAVDVSSRRLYHVEYDEVPSPWQVLRGRLLPFGHRPRVPGLVSVLLKSTEIGTMEKVRTLGEQADLLLRPPVSKFSFTDVRNYEKIVTAGYDYAAKQLANWPAARSA